MDIDDTTPCRFAHPPHTSAPLEARPRAPIWEAAHVYHDGDRASACLIDLSAAGGTIRTQLQLKPGDSVILGVHLASEIATIAGIDHLRLELDVEYIGFDGKPDEYGAYYYHCRLDADLGSESFRRAASVIVAAFERDAAA